MRSRDERGNWVIRAEIMPPGDDRPLCRARARFERDPAAHDGRFRRWLDATQAAAGQAPGAVS
ncbi:hypothetical protein [Pseudonocardia sp. WMMC193]|uniref:hypothetical protein n=1 Tax=Pseudonocardia sp. WMMC193 TaxID=2911965 RepID=UPI001F1DE96A|nr:hypothetical protein [Pseudonocardia sp. WMMC193]MCF7550805.1 hypothetical protein [Pseudonocardia sp. WMMC193]